MNTASQAYFRSLIARDEIEPVHEFDATDYERRYAESQLRNRITQEKVTLLKSRNPTSIDKLLQTLKAMRADASEGGFERDVARRRHNRNEAARLLRRLSAWEGTSAKEFSKLLVDLRNCFHSGQLQRQYGRIIKRKKAFVKIASAAIQAKSLPPSEAFQSLVDIAVDAPGVGLNWITEIMHVVNNERFAVLNKNSASGMSIAGLTLPETLTKQGFSAECYQEFCAAAKAACDVSGLQDLTELDAVLNYQYFNG